MHDNTRINLELVLENCLLIEQRLSKISNAADFINAPEGLIILDAIAMRLQYLGECIKRINKTDPQFFATYQEVEWSKIINMRDFISHHYEMLNHEMVHHICSVYIPQLKVLVTKILAK